MSDYISGMSEYVAKILLKHDIIDKDNYEVYVFGVYQNIVFLMNVLTSLLIFALFNLVVEGILFSVFYSLLRSYAGGYHSKSLFVCYALSALLTIGVAYIANNVVINYLMIICCIIAFIIVFWLSPVDTRNKRLDNIEMRVYQQKARCVLIACMVATICFYVVNYNQGVIVLSLAIIMEAVMIILGKLDNYMENKEGRIL